ncbi:transcription factor bHLH113-like [Hibiscus syriacus]|uniref:transcription factor bHLH113-like n=1 Tax=Hibiscus syriacus TaxID=106335 RepID=UPI00192046C1|nr:transcription factor bHLH113-like [Hibiscus syriacus]
MMAESDQGFEGDQSTATTTRFSQLLFGTGGGDDVVGLDLGQGFNYSCSFAVRDHDKSPKMLCFGGHQTDGQIVFGKESTIIAAKKTAACSDSSSASSGNNAKSSQDPSISNRKRNGFIVETRPASLRANKKSKADNPTTTGHSKVRKEKIGDRITALQQLVSPFGKTDTASVLHEAMGYIRFLHDQVQVLCSPYLQHPPNEGEEAGKELKSRGLCLVPIACTLHVANSNGADFWSPAMGNDV